MGHMKKHLSKFLVPVIVCPAAYYAWQYKGKARPIYFDKNWDGRRQHSQQRDIYLIRHGQYHTKETDPNLRTLTDLGKEQAKMTGKWLKENKVNPDQFIFSTLVRATETANIIFNELNVNEKNVSCSRLLEEGSPHQIEPLNDKYRSEKIKKIIEKDGPRIEDAFKTYIHRGHGAETAVLVCHANVIRYFITRVMQIDPHCWLRFQPEFEIVGTTTFARND